MTLSLSAMQAFIPYTNVFTKALADSPTITEHACPQIDTAEAKSIFIHANVISITKKYVEVDRNLCEVEGITENCIVDYNAPIGCSAYSRAKANGTLDEGFTCTCLNGEDESEEHVQNTKTKTTKVRFDYLVYVGKVLL